MPDGIVEFDHQGVDHYSPEQRQAIADLLAAEKKKKAKLAKPAPLPGFFVRGDDVEVGKELAQSLGGEGDVVSVENRLWQFDGFTWRRWEDAELAKRAQGVV